MKTQLCKGILALFLFGLLVSGCDTTKKKSAENDIKFDSIRVEKTYHLLDNPEYPNCNLQLNFLYPVKAENKEILEKIQQQFVLAYLGEGYEKFSPGEAIAKYTENYLKAYKDLENDFKTELAKSGDSPIPASFSFYEMSSDDIAYNRNNILCYTVNFVNYTGGAHGAHSFTNHVLNLKTGEPITEADLFIENYQDDLAQILIDKIAKQNKVENPKDLENIGFFSVDEIFPNGNFLIDDNGITYTFNEYEIAAYVVGDTKVYLPYKEIQHLLKKDSPISHIVGK